MESTESTCTTTPLERNPSNVMSHKIVGFLTVTTSVISVTVLRFLGSHTPKLGFREGNYTHLALSALVISTIFQGVNFVVTFSDILQFEQIKKYRLEISTLLSMIPGWCAATYLDEQGFLPSQYKIFFLAFSALSFMYVNYKKEINENLSKQTIENLFSRITQLRAENYMLEQTLYQSCQPKEELLLLTQQYMNLMQHKQRLLKDIEKMQKKQQKIGDNQYNNDGGKDDNSNTNSPANTDLVNKESTECPPKKIDMLWGEIILLRGENYMLEQTVYKFYQAEGKCAFLTDWYVSLLQDNQRLKKLK